MIRCCAIKEKTLDINRDCGFQTCRLSHNAHLIVNFFNVWSLFDLIIKSRCPNNPFEFIN